MKISCEVFHDLLPLVVDGVASQGSAALVHEHMAECDGCKRLFEDSRGSAPHTEQEPRVAKLKAVLFAALAAIVLIGCAIGYFMSNASTPMPVLLVVVSVLLLVVFAILLFRGGLNMSRFFFGKAIGTVVLFGLLGIYLLLRYVLKLF